MAKSSFPKQKQAQNQRQWTYFIRNYILETFLSRQKKRLAEDDISEIDWNLFAGIHSAASGEVVAEDALAEALKARASLLHGYNA